MTDLAWKRSSKCGNTTYIEVQNLGEIVRIRDSTQPGKVLAFSGREWSDFVLGVRAGEFGGTL